MNCDEVNRLLDQLMDGELTDDQRLELEAHGRSCPGCAAAIRQTMQLKALFADAEPEVDVPLAAQAAWRNAVREEARRDRKKRTLRWFASAAAALVVLVGVGLAMNLRGAPRQSAMPELAAETDYEMEEAAEAAAGSAPIEVKSLAGTAGAVIDAGEADVADDAVIETDSAVIEADGLPNSRPVIEEGEEPRVFAAAAQRSPACELSLRVADVDQACGRVLDLVNEYEGAADVQRLEDGGANIYVEIPSDNASDFLTAALPLDASGQERELPVIDGEGTTLVLLTLTAEG